MSDAKQAVVLLSGGLDSATVLAIAKSRGFQCHAISFRYGQRHGVELQAARKVAEALSAKSHRIVDIDLRAFGGSALTDDGIAVPRDRTAAEMADEIPVTYVPARNTVFLSYALALAEVKGARDLFIGANAVDYSGYPDCRPAFLAAFEALANLATKMGVEAQSEQERVRVHAPIVAMTKAQIIRAGVDLGVDYAQTWSCYDPQPAEDGARACGHCDSCAIRRQGFVDAGVADPTRYLAARAGD
jgi:7-cyano-7-deazaguanine synthase